MLDPEQNSTFRDNHLDVPFDLSKVLFITTANVIDPLPDALRDRMEIISLEGYTEQEKVVIAFRYLIPRRTVENGSSRPANSQLRATSISPTRPCGSWYSATRARREYATWSARLARSAASRRGVSPAKTVILPEIVEKHLGPPRFRTDTEVAERTRRPGVALGLAWTPVGGDVLFIEAGRMPGGNKADHDRAAGAGDAGIGTGGDDVGAELRHQIRDRSRPVQDQRYPYTCAGGSVPKDSPSAGITMATALLSMLMDRRVRPNLAMTGEITLTGQVLPVGGIKEKVLAAKRSGVREVILPFENEVNVREHLKREQIGEMELHFVKLMDEVVEMALEKKEAV